MRPAVIKNSFNTGEISPYAMGRTDIDKYKNACESLQNYIPLIQGGAQRRPGTRYGANAMGASRLLAFKFLTTQGYIFEFGDQKLRFYTNNGQVQASGGGPYQISTPYALADLWGIKYAQIGDIIYLVHPNYPVQKLSRLAANNWVLSAPNFQPPPSHSFDQDVSYGSTTISISQNTTGPGFVSASNPTFLPGDVGKLIISGTGAAYITGVIGASGTVPGGGTGYLEATVNFIDAFTAPDIITAGNWFLRGSPSSIACFGGLALSPSHFFATSQFGPGNYTLFTFSSYPVDDTAPVFEDTFRSVDVGSFVVIGGAVGQIQSIVNGHQVNVQLLSVIETTISFTNPSTGNSGIIMQAASGGTWSIEQPSFSDANGYPTAICFFQDRLCLAGTAAQPQQVWMSQISNYENFAKGPEDDDAIDEQINSGYREQIQWLSPYLGFITCGTPESEYILTGGALVVGGNGPAITPTNFSATIQSRYGVANIQPVTVEDNLLYVQRMLQTTFEFTYDIYHGVFGSKNLNLFSDIITTAGFKEMVLAYMPYRLLAFTTVDGNLVTLTYNKEQDVWAWARHFTGQDLANADGWISVASIPNPEGLADQLWFCTARTINDTVEYFIEIWDPSFDLYVDAASQQTFSTAVSSISGLSYLQGRYIYINADGAVVGPVQVPSSGTIALPVPAKIVQAGLPFCSQILTVRPEVQGAPTTQGMLKRWLRAWIRLYNSIGGNINGQVLPFRTPSDNMSQAVPVPAGNLTGGGGTPSPAAAEGALPFLSGGAACYAGPGLLTTFDVNVGNLGWDRDGRVLIQQHQPLPHTVLAMFGLLNVGEV